MQMGAPGSSHLGTWETTNLKARKRRLPHRRCPFAQTQVANDNAPPPAPHENLRANSLPRHGRCYAPRASACPRSPQCPHAATAHRAARSQYRPPRRALENHRQPSAHWQPKVAHQSASNKPPDSRPAGDRYLCRAASIPTLCAPGKHRSASPYPDAPAFAGPVPAHLALRESPHPHRPQSIAAHRRPDSGSASIWDRSPSSLPTAPAPHPPASRRCSWQRTQAVPMQSKPRPVRRAIPVAAYQSHYSTRKSTQPCGGINPVFNALAGAMCFLFKMSYTACSFSARWKSVQDTSHLAASSVRLKTAR